MSRRILCILFGHRPDDGRVRTPHDELTARCRWCGRRVRLREGGWKLRPRHR